MHLPQVLPCLALLSLSQAAETIVGVYIFSRHGDRTPKSTPPVNLTNLGYREIFDSGTYYRDRYVSSFASNKIAGLNTDTVKLSQISVSAPLDNVLMSSAQGFLQGLYPPVGSALAQETLRNNTVIEAPLNGYQLIPIQTVTSGTGSEDSAWLQGAGDCAKALVSSSSYYTSLDYMKMLDSTQDLYNSLTPAINATFSPEEISFKNAFTIYDLLNVAEIHNATIPSSILTNTTLSQLRTLADTLEHNLAYNNTEPIRAIAGSMLASEVVKALNTTITSAGKTAKITIQFGAYASFLSFFGLTNLTIADPDFFGIPDYASSMAFELFTTSNTTPSQFPSTEDLQVRFLFHNGTTSNISTPIAYPLFGQQKTVLSWNEFSMGMNQFAIGSQEEWCSACGNTTGVCAGSIGAADNLNSAGGGTEGVSKAVAGVIGAMVTLAVVLGLEAAFMLIGGWRLVGRRKLRESKEGGSPGLKA
ncbi:MAG: hypothetical protein Q9164_002859 [Protoblastenia rupestris]